MKKLLLVLFVLSIGLFIKGQNLGNRIIFPKPAYKLFKPIYIPAKESPSVFLSSKSPKNNVTSGDLHSYYIKSSVNVNTLLVPQSTCLTANQNINTVMFTCREDHFTNTIDN